MNIPGETKENHMKLIRDTRPPNGDLNQKPPEERELSHSSRDIPSSMLQWLQVNHPTLLHCGPSSILQSASGGHRD
jgi:hypothetical protein